MRTAYFCEPNTLTCATPLTIEMRCATLDCASSSSAESGSVLDRMTMKKIAWSAGLTFWYDGGTGICAGLTSINSTSTQCGTYTTLQFDLSRDIGSTTSAAAWVPVV